MDHQNKLNALWKELKALKSVQDQHQAAIMRLERKIELLQKEADEVRFSRPIEKLDTPEQKPIITPTFSDKKPQFSSESQPKAKPKSPSNIPFQNQSSSAKKEKKSFNIEQFLGEKVILKLGVFILLIGLIIGSKYAIDQNLVTPLMRIIASYTIGAGLLLAAYFTIEKYKFWSGIVVSGALATFFFTTFFAHDTYQLMSKEIAFGLMLLFSIFTFLASLYYNQKYIAIIAICGSYALPFLLSDGSGNYIFLFTYLIIINLGIMAISYYKEWSIVYYLSFLFSWIILFGWMFSVSLKVYAIDAAIFANIFFLQFYLMIVLNKWVKKAVFKIHSLMVLTGNALFYFIAGSAIIARYFTHEEIPLTFFILVNATIHAAFAYSLYKKAIFDPAAIWVLLAMVITLVIIIIPINFEGEIISLAWLLMSALLSYGAFKIKQKALKVYSFVLLGISILSLFMDLGNLSNNHYYSHHFVNIHFYIILICCSIIIFQGFLYRRWYASKELIMVHLGWILSGIGLVIMASSISISFESLYDFLRFNSIKTISDVEYFNPVWSIYQTYTNIIIALGTVLTFYYTIVVKVKNSELQFTSYFVVVLFIAISLFSGVKQSMSLLELSQYQDLKYELFASSYHSFWAYVYLLGLLALSIFWIRQLSVFQLSKNNEIRQVSLMSTLLVFFSIFLAFITSSIGQFEHYSITLSIFWGVYALILFIIGFKKDQINIRKGALILAGISLVKLFFVDLKNTDNLQKTILFVALGMVFIAVSFLYNKFKKQEHES